MCENAVKYASLGIANTVHKSFWEKIKPKPSASAVSLGSLEMENLF